MFDSFFKNWLESLHAVGQKNWAEVFKALEPMLAEERVAKATDVWYGTDVVWLNMKKLMDNGVPLEMAKDITLAVYAEKGPAEAAAEDMGEFLSKMLPAVMETTPPTWTEGSDVEDAEVECGRCGSHAVMADSGLCAACYVGDSN